MEIGERIKKLREFRNFTQQYMAEQLELSLSGYGKIERDETDISVTRLEQIANVLGVDVNTILNFDEKHIFNFNNNQTANAIINQHNSVQMELVEKLVNQYKDENLYLKEIIKDLMSNK